MQRTFVIGDIHGAYKAMMQCFSKASFDYEKDRLILLGDLFDGWSDIPKLCDELLKIKHLVYVRGNHDQFVIEWLQTGEVSQDWKLNGGELTIKYYKNKFPESHRNLVESSVNYYIHNDMLFVHAGFDSEVELEKQSTDILLWDRTIAHTALGYYKRKENVSLHGFKKIFLGHTPTHTYSMKPIICGNIYLLDTGAGWNGWLTMMDINNDDIFESENVTRLYPKETGRFGILK